MQSLTRVVKSSLSNQTVRQGAILMAANSAGNVLQYVFHAYVSRSLGPEEYGVFAALLALFVIVGVPSNIAQTVITQYVSRFRALNELSKAAGLFNDSLKYFLLAGIVVFFVISVASPAIALFLNISSFVPVIAMASVFLATGVATAVTGTLQGLQKFYVIAANGFLGPIFRLMAVVVLVSLGWGASGALGASTVSTTVLLVVGLFFLREVLRLKSERHGLMLGAVSWYSSVVLVGTLAYTMLTNIDLIVVKHFFSPEDAGYYSAATVLGKIILFFPAAVTTVIFPKASQRFALGKSASDIARKGVFVILGLCGSAAIVLAILAPLAVRLMFGSRYEESIPLVGLYGATMGLYALVQLLMTFYMAQEESRFVWLMAAITALLSIGLFVFHVSLVQVIISLAISALAILLISEVWLGGLRLGRRLS